MTFEGGDPDKSIVLGALYNGTHPPPFLLPGDKTRSGIRTQSSPGGSGSNDLAYNHNWTGPGGLVVSKSVLHDKLNALGISDGLQRAKLIRPVWV